MYGSILTSQSDLFAHFDRLREQLDQLFVNSSAPTGIRTARLGAFPPVNSGVSADSVEIVSFVPGIDANSLKVTVDKGLLTIEGERKNELSDKQRQDQVTVYAQERFVGPFKRVISLPEDADSDKIDARYRDGVLHIKIAKKESAKPRRLTIK